MRSARLRRSRGAETSSQADGGAVELKRERWRIMQSWGWHVHVCGTEDAHMHAHTARGKARETGRQAGQVTGVSLVASDHSVRSPHADPPLALMPTHRAGRLDSPGAARTEIEPAIDGRRGERRRNPESARLQVHSSYTSISAAANSSCPAQNVSSHSTAASSGWYAQSGSMGLAKLPSSSAAAQVRNMRVKLR